MKVVLNEVEQRLARYVASCRYNSNRRDGVENARIGPQSDAETDLNGVGAEIAFAKYTNTFPDLEIGRGGNSDVYTTGMGGVDVKTTKYRGGRLLARLSKRGKAPDAYALMVGEFPEYRFVGWTSADELLQDNNIVDMGHGNTFGMRQEALRK